MGRKYSVGLVGESHYQAAVGLARPGDPVILAFEPDNPYDADAIVALDHAGRTLGYVPRDSFLQRILHDEGGNVAAEVKAVRAGNSGKLGLVLDVELDAGENPVVSYRRAEPPMPGRMKATMLDHPEESEAKPPVWPWLTMLAVILLTVGWMIS
jgi:hypothetical protein